MRVNLNWALELKVLIVLAYYVLLGSAVLTIFSIALVDLQGYIQKFKTLLECENGRLPSNSSKPILCTTELKELQKYEKPYLTTIAFSFFGFLPVVNFVYIVKIKELLDKLKCYHAREIPHVQRENESGRSNRYVPYQLHREAITSTIHHHGSLTAHTNSANTEPMISSQRNNDLRQ